MSTTGRHSRILITIASSVVEFLRRKEAYAFQEECALVHWGYKGKSDFKELVKISDIEDIDSFVEMTINELDYVQPDFVLFKNNPYLHNEIETKIAGCPDLIVEVWSRGNTKAEREFKLDLYSSSPITEHWYIEQDRNEVTCYFGRNKLENQYLTDKLKTRDGLEFDLRYLAI
jgi:Uma2 family endonuclease